MPSYEFLTLPLDVSAALRNSARKPELKTQHSLINFVLTLEEEYLNSFLSQFADLSTITLQYYYIDIYILRLFTPHFNLHSNHLETLARFARGYSSILVEALQSM